MFGIKPGKKRNRLLILSLCLLIVTVIGTFKIMFRPPTPEMPEIEGHIGIPIAHANPLDPKTGCAKCHTEPIVKDCTDCHSKPPTEIEDISFPHHDTKPGGPLDNCKSCHTEGKNDARYVDTPDFDHGYCTSCHQLEHSPPP